jgi:hypothetical protein
MAGRHRATLELITPEASPAEAAAIVAALERFAADTAPRTGRPEGAVDPWLRAAILEGVGRGESPDAYEPWINT